MATRYTIVVGGIGGNVLLGAPGLLFGGAQEVWLSPLALASGGIRALQLAPDGVSPAIPGFGLTGGPVLSFFYGGLCDALRLSGFIPISYEQDWRMRIDLAVNNLVAGIVALGADTPVTIVCHSRGGLVTRAALQSMTLADRSRYVGRVVGLGVPHQGSWLAVGLIGGWAPFYISLLELIERAGSILFAPGSSQLIESIVASWPAAYELFPRPGAGGVEPASILACYNPATWSAVGRTASATWLASAVDRWAAAQYAPADVEWLDVIGSAHPTPVALLDPTRPDLSASYQWTNDGDGVVPSGWAVQPGRQRITSSADHSQLAYEGVVTGAAVQWLITGQAGPH